MFAKADLRLLTKQLYYGNYLMEAPAFKKRERFAKFALELIPTGD